MRMKFFLGLMSLVVGLLGILGIVPSLFSVMMFDAPGSTENPATIALFLSVASFPFVCCGAIVSTWSLYGAGRKAWSCIVIWTPVLNLIVAGIAIYCLNTFFGGKFNA